MQDRRPNRLGSIFVGGPAIHSAGSDFLHFAIEDEVRTQLIQDNFIPAGYNLEPVQIWNPGKYQKKIADADTQEILTALEAKTRPVTFIGSLHTKPVPALIAKKSGRLTNTFITKQDSGGCIIDKKMRYVALLSNGGRELGGSSGGSVLLHDAFASAGLILATWADRAHWQ